MLHTVHYGKLYEETNKCNRDCLLTTPTCFGLLLRPFLGSAVSKSIKKIVSGESVQDLNLQNVIKS
jgi:hypothetical protein